MAEEPPSKKINYQAIEDMGAIIKKRLQEMEKDTTYAMVLSEATRKDLADVDPNSSEFDYKPVIAQWEKDGKTSVEKLIEDLGKDNAIFQKDQEEYHEYLEKYKSDEFDLRCEFFVKLFLIDFHFRVYVALRPEDLMELIYAPDKTSRNSDLIQLARASLGTEFLENPVKSQDPMLKTTLLLIKNLSVKNHYSPEPQITQHLPVIPYPFCVYPQIPQGVLLRCKNIYFQKILDDRANDAKEFEKKMEEVKEKIKEKDKAYEELDKRFRRLNLELSAQKQILVVKSKPKVVEVGEPVVIIVESRDLDGTPKYYLKHEIEFVISDEFNFKDKSIQDKSNGTYELKITPERLGNFNVTIKESGKLAVDGEFVLTVSRDYKKVNNFSMVLNLRPAITPFKGVWGITVDEDDHVYVVDTDNQSVYMFDPEFQFFRSFTCAKEGLDPYPRGLAVFKEQKDGGEIKEIAVISANTHRVQIYDYDGKHKGSFGTQGKAENQFNTPRGACLGPSKELLVVDTDNHRIQVLNREPDTPGAPPKFFTALRRFGAHGAGVGQFNYPSSVAWSKERRKIVISDCDNNRIQLFDWDATNPFTFGTIGNQDGQFNRPTGIAVDPLGNIIVADMSNHRIQVFDPQGKFMCKIGVTSTGQNLMNGPRGLGVTSSGKIVVADFGNKRVLVF